MRYQDGLVSVVALLLSLVTVAGIAFTEKFPQAARAESVGFDALAHGLFDGAALACNDNRQPRTVHP